MVLVDAINAVQLPPLSIQLGAVNGLKQSLLQHGLPDSVLPNDVVLAVVCRQRKRGPVGQIDLLHPLIVELLDEVAQQLVVDLLLDSRLLGLKDLHFYVVTHFSFNLAKIKLNIIESYYFGKCQ